MRVTTGAANIESHLRRRPTPTSSLVRLQAMSMPIAIVVEMSGVLHDQSTDRMGWHVCSRAPVSQISSGSSALSWRDCIASRKP